MSNSTFILTTGGVYALKSQIFNVDEVDQDDPKKTSLLGTNVWSNLVFPAGNYETLEGEEIAFEEFVIDSVLMSVSQVKNVVKTAIQGRNGTVKEYISDGDYAISIEGVIVGSGSNVYPEVEVLNLLEILKAPVSIKVESEFLNYFDIDEIVVESFDFNQVEGSRNTQPFQITASSDEPLELKDSSGI